MENSEQVEQETGCGSIGEEGNTPEKSLRETLNERKSNLRKAFLEKYLAESDPTSKSMDEIRSSLCGALADVSAAYVEIAESLGRLSQIVGGMISRLPVPAAQVEKPTTNPS